jgi:valyl-tRNA synthetase
MSCRSRRGVTPAVVRDAPLDTIERPWTTDRRSLLESRTRYDPLEVERRVFGAWQAADAFRSDPEASGEPYTIMLPLPNVTGLLHMGHALNGSCRTC